MVGISPRLAAANALHLDNPKIVPASSTVNAS
jgi:hypothetical protein